MWCASGGILGGAALPHPPTQAVRAFTSIPTEVLYTRIIASLIILVVSPLLASAQVSTSPGYTRFDQQQQAKLHVFLGTWKCVDVPASKKPDIQTTTQVGNYFVTRETGDNPNAAYLRWSHSYKIYYVVELDDSGGTQVSQTRSLDPTNSTWTPAFPTHDTNGNPSFRVN